MRKKKKNVEVNIYEKKYIVIRTKNFGLGLGNVYVNDSVAEFMDEDELIDYIKKYGSQNINHISLNKPINIEQGVSIIEVSK